ncbi:MAG: rRNA pseudouridine synthase [Clostridia bacterium]|nr:rRNA pseudouridine synthase [Clostridia bacterium]
MIRLNKFLAMSGVCSRRMADKYIEDGKVSINGNVASELGTIINEEKDIVKVDGKCVKIEKKKVYIVLNKPAGYITTSKEQFGRPYILDLIKEKERVFPVGRLDMDTEGLIILTNDGDFANDMMHPSKKVNKTYVAKVMGKITEDKIRKLEKGVLIDGYVTAEAKVRLLEKQTLEITIHEGKNRQIKKMARAVGLRVEKLKRTKIGNLDLEKIPVGKYKLMSEKMIKEKIFG